MDSPTLTSIPPRMSPGLTLRTPSRSPTRHRMIDDILSDLSPTTTLEAFTSPSGKLRASVEAATASERAFGIRATLASQKIEEWVSELLSWPWPAGGGPEGFEIPQDKRQKLSFSEPEERNQRSSHQDEKTELMSDILYIGSLPAKNVLEYEKRVQEIHEDMEELDVEEIKQTVLNNFSSRSRPSSPASHAAPPPSLLSNYTKMDDFTAVVTATVLKALPNLMRLMRLMDVWSIRLTVLRKIPPLLVLLDDAELALKSGWQAIQISGQGNGDTEEQYLERDAFEVIKSVLEEKVTTLGQQLDYMLDTLEGREDVLPEHWLDRMEAIETEYGNWAVRGNTKVRECEWAKLARKRKVEADRLRAEEEAKDAAARLESGRLHQEEAARLQAQVKEEAIYLEAECSRKAEVIREKGLAEEAERIESEHQKTDDPKLILAADTARLKAEQTVRENEVPSKSKHENARLYGERAGDNPDAKLPSRQIEDAKLADIARQQAAPNDELPKLLAASELSGASSFEHVAKNGKDYTTPLAVDNATDPASEVDKTLAESDLADDLAHSSDTQASSFDGTVTDHSAHNTTLWIQPQTGDLNNLLLDGTPRSSSLNTIKNAMSIEEQAQTRAPIPPQESLLSLSGSTTIGEVFPTLASIEGSVDGASESTLLPRRSDSLQLQEHCNSPFSTRDSSIAQTSTEMEESMSRRYSFCSNCSTVVTRDNIDAPSPPLSPPSPNPYYNSDYKSEVSDHFPDADDDLSPSSKVDKPFTKDASISTSQKSDLHFSPPTDQTFSKDLTQTPWSDDSVPPSNDIAHLPELQPSSPHEISTSPTSSSVQDNPTTPTTPTTETSEIPTLITSSPFDIPSTPTVGAPSLPNLEVSEDLPTGPLKKNAIDDPLQSQISSLLATLPARIHLQYEPEQDDVSVSQLSLSQNITFRPSNIRRSLTPTMRSHSSLSSRAPTPNFTLTPAYGRGVHRPRHSSAQSEINVYHLSHHGEAPIKLFIRRVGENGERLMVRVGGGWSDLGAYLTEYAAHHRHRVSSGKTNNMVEVQNFGSSGGNRSVSGSSMTTVRGARDEDTNGRSSPGPRPSSVLERERPLSSLYIRKTRKSLGEKSETSTSIINMRSPSTPQPSSYQSPNYSTPPGRSVSRLSWTEEETGLGLAGPNTRPKIISEESQEWVQSMTEKVKQASAEKEEKSRKSYGELGSKKLFRKSGGV
jgi:hypothetical protein